MLNSYATNLVTLFEYNKLKFYSGVLHNNTQRCEICGCVVLDFKNVYSLNLFLKYGLCVNCQNKYIKTNNL